MKKINNLKGLPNTQEVIINIPKNLNSMVISYIYVDENNKVYFVQEDIDEEKLEEIINERE